MGIQIRAAKKKARERRPGNIAQRWSRNVQGYRPGTEKEEYMVMPLYVIGRTGRGGGGGGIGGVAGMQPPPCAYMEVVDAGGDTVMCCCDCGGGGGRPNRCRLRGFLRQKGEVWARGEAVEVEFTHGDVAFLKEVMKDSHVSTKIEIYYE